jgi:hypothetical protein
MPTRVSSYEDWSISTVLRLRPPHPTTRGSYVLGVGIDWAEEFHLVALGRPGEGVFDVARVEHTPGATDALVARHRGGGARPRRGAGRAEDPPRDAR